MTIDASKIAKVKTAMDNRYENKQANKKSDITGDFTGDTVSYPTVTAVKDYITSLQYAKQSDFAQFAQGILTLEEKANKVSEWSQTLSNTKYPSEKLVKDSLDTKIDKSNTIGLVKNDGTIDTNTYLTTHQSLAEIGGAVTVEKQQTAESGYAHTYVVKQNGSQVGSKINIPKDLLLQSATKEVVGATPTSVETANNLTTGDVYLKFVVNTVDNDNATTLVIPANDLVDNTVYTAGSGLTLTSGEFSISNGDITKQMLATGIQTSLDYADDYNSSPASSITSTQISNWDTMVSSGVATSDIDDRINQALDDLAELIYPTGSS